MNILNKNKIGILLAKDDFGFRDGKQIFEHKMEKKRKINGTQTDSFDKQVVVNTEMMEFRCQKIVRISNSIYLLAQSIKMDSILKNIDAIDMKFTDIAILMPSDEIGAVQIKKVGGDIFFIWVQNMNKGINSLEYEINYFNFFTKEFGMTGSNKSNIIIQILTYLFYGDINEILCRAKQKVRCNSFKYLKNDSNYDIWYADTLWKTKISLIGEFKVSGHFRLQPHGEGRAKRKLIFIDEFVKHGYRRNATVENFNTTN